MRIDPPRRLGRNLGFQRAEIGVGEQWLAVEVRQLDDIMVDDRQLAHARRRQIGDRGTADPARADPRDLARFPLRLARSEARGVGNELVRTLQSRWYAYNKTKK